MYVGTLRLYAWNTFLGHIFIEARGGEFGWRIALQVGR